MMRRSSLDVFRCWLARSLAAAVLVLVSAFSCIASELPLWGPLSPGPHAVGFLVDHEYDHGRSWSWPASAGRAKVTPTGRPIRLMVWYPAVRETGRPMQFRDYVFMPTADPLFAHLESRLSDYDLGKEGGGLLGVVGGSQAKLRSLLELAVPARMGADPAAGRHPLVLYSLGQNDMTQENVVLWEYLASHGFVVVTVPHLGISPRKFHLWMYEGLSFEAQLRDLEFALDRLAREEWTDSERVAVMGHSMGGTYAILLAMRNPSVDAVIGLDASFVVQQPSFQFDFQAATYFQPWRVKAPVLQLFRRRDEPDDRVLDQLIYADVQRVELRNLTHGDFQGWRLFPDAALDPADLAVRSADVGAHGFELVTTEVLRFLRQSLQGAAAPIPRQGERSVDGVMIAERFSAGVRAPDAEGLYLLLDTEGLDSALAVIERARRQHPGRDLVAETEMIALGNELRWGGQAERAVEFFRLFVAAAPGSPAAHWKLGQALEETGNVAAAAEEYRSTLRLKPDHAEARERLDALAPPPR